MDVIDEIRNKYITGTFAIGIDGRKEPTDWKQYAKLLEGELSKNRDVEISDIWDEIQSVIIDASVNHTNTIAKTIINIFGLLRIDLSEKQRKELEINL